MVVISVRAGIPQADFLRVVKSREIICLDVELNRFLENYRVSAFIIGNLSEVLKLTSKN